MIVVFKEEYLRDLYMEGKSKDKKHRFQPEIVRRYKSGIDYLKWAPCKEDLFRINSLHFKALTGDKSNLFSIRVNNQYRIEFEINDNTDDPTLNICNIVELSNHYK